MSKNLEPSLLFLKDLADYALFEMSQVKNKSSKVPFDVKSNKTPVTIIDKTINKYVLDRMKEYYPHVSVYAEEKNQIIPNAEYVLICDELDGTLPYIGGINVATFCVSLLRNGIPIKTVIKEPSSRRTWSAEKGKGTFLDREQVFVSSKKEIDGSFIHLQRWKKSSYYLNEVHDYLEQKGAKVLNYGATAFLGALVSSGSFDASIFPGKNAWETAALKLLVEEAGGKVTHIDGSPMKKIKNNRIKGHLITNNYLHDSLLGIIIKHNKNFK